MKSNYILYHLLVSTLSFNLAIPALVDNTKLTNTPIIKKASSTNITVQRDPKKIGSQKTEVAPGITLTVLDDEEQGEAEDITYVPVKHLYINSGRVNDIHLGKEDISTGLSVQVIPPDNSEIRTDIVPDKMPDKKEAVAFNNNSKSVKIKKGPTYSFSFNVISSQTGKINFYNSNNELISSVPYKVSPYKSVRQSLNIGATSNINIIGGDFDDDPNVNVSYSRSGDGWSNSLTVSGGPSGTNISGNLSWNW